MSAATSAQPLMNDPVKVDAGHYGVEYEDDRVRIVRARYAAGERSVMHAHPELVAVMLTKCTIRMTYPDGRSEEIQAEPGQVMRMPAVEHLPQNVGDQPFEAILVELKG